MAQAVEIVHFKLNENVTDTDFLKSNDAFEKFLNEQPGMLYRSLCKSNSTATYTDIVYWQSLEQAQVAQQAFFDSELCIEFAKCIEKDSVILDHLDILAQSQCDSQAKAS